MVTYHEDQLRILTSWEGIPTWQGTFPPFEQEWKFTPSTATPALVGGPDNPQITRDPSPGSGFRQQTPASLTPAKRLKFTGKERDAESGLDFFGARFYSSTMGRWLSPDWSATPEAVPYADLNDPQTLNLYGYVRNNPMSKADPDGHCCWDEIKDSAAFLGGELVGAAKGLVNAVPATYNTFAELNNEQGAAAGQGQMQLPLAPTLSLNGTAETVGAAVATLGLVVAGGAEGTATKSEGATVGTGAAKEGIYEGPDAQAPGRTYVGQSENIPRRIEEHASGKFPPGTKVSTAEVKGGKTAREVAEHQRIQQLGGVRSKPGSTTSNIRNPIGKNRQHLLPKNQDR